MIESDSTLFLIPPQITPLRFPDVIAVNHYDRKLFSVGELNGADNGVASWNLLAGQIGRQPIRRRCFWAVNDADLAVAPLRERQVNGVRLKLIDLLETVPAHEVFPLPRSCPAVRKIVVLDAYLGFCEPLLSERSLEEFARKRRQQSVGDDVVDHAPARIWIVTHRDDMIDHRLIVDKGSRVIFVNALADSVEL